MNVLAILAKAIKDYVINLIMAKIEAKIEAARAGVTTVKELNKFFGSIRFGATFNWRPGFHKKWNGRFNKAQVWLDNEVLKDCEPFTPLRTGTLRNSGTLGTHIGAGKVQWIAPYTRTQYYKGR